MRRLESLLHTTSRASVRTWSGDVFQRVAIMLPLMTGLALALRLYKLGYHDYWDDEVISTFAARPPLSEIFSSIATYSIHPPFYYGLLHIWITLFGDELITARLLSVLISTACVPLIYLLGRRLASKPVALIAALIMAFAPFHIFHGQQARMYPLLTLLVIGTTLFFHSGWTYGGWGRWLAFGLCITAGLYTHVYFAFSLAALNLWALYDTYRQRRIQRSRWGGLLIAQACGGLAFIPFVPQMFGTVGGVVQWYWIGDTTAISWVFTILNLSNNATAEQVLDAPIWYLVVTCIAGVAAATLTLTYSMREAYRHPEERPVWLLLHLLLWTPVVVATVISLTIKPILLDRSLIGISSALYVLMAWMFVRYWRVRIIQIVALAFVLSCIASLAFAYPDSPRQNDLIRMADYLASEQRPDDAVAFADWQAFDTTFLTHPELQNVYVLTSPARSRVQFSSETEWLARLEYMRWHSPQNVQPVAEFAPRYERVWLVLTRYTYNLDYHQRVNQGWLEEHGRLIQSFDFERAVVFLYEVSAE